MSPEALSLGLIEAMAPSCNRFTSSTSAMCAASTPLSAGLFVDVERCAARTILQTPAQRIVDEAAALTRRTR